MNSPAELWENVLSQRAAFRRLPQERLRAEDYYSEDRKAPDKTYSLSLSFRQSEVDRDDLIRALEQILGELRAPTQ